jgi:hypothetical protein
MYLNEWFDFCEILKITTSFDTLRSILFSSFTIGIPMYVIEQKEDFVFFRNVNTKRQQFGTTNNTNNESPIDETKKTRFSKSELVNNNLSENLRLFKSPLKSSRLLTKSFNSQSNHSISSFASENRNNIDMTETYEPFIDNLLGIFILLVVLVY